MILLRNFNDIEQQCSPKTAILRDTHWNPLGAALVTNQSFYWVDHSNDQTLSYTCVDSAGYTSYTEPTEPCHK